jgi:hypothetical protein
VRAEEMSPLSYEHGRRGSPVLLGTHLSDLSERDKVVCTGEGPKYLA